MGSFSAAPRPRSSANSSRSAEVAKSCGEVDASPVPSLGFGLAPRRDLSQHAAGARVQTFPSSDALVAKPGVARLMVGERLDPAKLLFRPLQAAKSLESPDQMVVQRQEITDIFQRIGDLLGRQRPLRPVGEG